VGTLHSDLQATEVLTTRETSALVIDKVGR